MNTKNILLAIACAITTIACTKKPAKKTNVLAANIETSIPRVSKTALKEKPLLAMAATNDNTVTKLVQNPVVFLTDYDEDSNKFYSKAKAHFKSKGYTIVDNVFSLEDIIKWLNNHADAKAYGEIHIVSQSKSWNGISLKDTDTGVKITDKTLAEALETKKLPALESVFNKDSKIILHSCGLGNNTALLKNLKKALSSNYEPTLYASALFDIFGSEFSEHYLAKAYYGYYPTANSPGKVDLAKDFAKKYPKTEINWLNALYKKTAPYVGGIYTYQFNIPVEWDLTFNSKDDIPVFKTKQDLLNFIAENDEIQQGLAALKIPAEKFRWNERTRGNRLIIEGKVTVVTILEPTMSYESATQYMEPTIDNKDLYTRI